MKGRVVHFEVPFDDGDRARSFYSDVFGWQINHLPEMSYDIVSTGPTDDQGMPTEVGYIGGGMLERQAPATKPVITIEVDDIDATLAAIEQRGGTTLRPRMAVGDMGYAAYFEDCEGNLLGLWETAS